MNKLFDFLAAASEVVRTDIHTLMDRYFDMRLKKKKKKEFSGFLLAFTGEGEGEEGVDRILLQSRAIRSPLLAARSLDPSSDLNPPI